MPPAPASALTVCRMCRGSRCVGPTALQATSLSTSSWSTCASMWTPLPHCLSVGDPTGVFTVKTRGPVPGPLPEGADVAQVTVFVALSDACSRTTTSGLTSPACAYGSEGNTVFSHCERASPFGNVVVSATGLPPTGRASGDVADGRVRSRGGARPEISLDRLFVCTSCTPR